jgi:hypothetical protein
VADRRSGEQRILERQMTDEAIAARTKRRSRSELRRADNDQLLEWWVADRGEEVRSELAVALPADGQKPGVAFCQPR